jgi:hypothetical protein
MATVCSEPAKVAAIRGMSDRWKPGEEGDHSARRWANLPLRTRCSTCMSKR